MNRISAVVVVLMAIGMNVFGDSASLRTLDYTLSQKKSYIKIKEDRIGKIRKNYIEREGANPVTDYYSCIALFNEYRSYKYDSAYHYVLKAKNIARFEGNPVLLEFAKIQEGFMYLSSGLFKESIDTLRSVRHRALPDSIMLAYYTTIARSYFDLADYDKDPFFSKKYKRIGNLYLDTALRYVAKNSRDYWPVESLRLMKIPDWEAAAKAFEYWIKNYQLKDHEYAIATSSLGYVYMELNRRDEAMNYLELASIADIKASTRETVALRNLSNLLFLDGKTAKAYAYIKEALDDATLYNARHRKIEIASILPIIEGEQLTTIESQKSKLIKYSSIITILVVLAFFFVVVIYNQLRLLRKAKFEMLQTNEVLNCTNLALKEANAIKDEYIGYFFNINSDFLERIESYQKSINRKIAARQFDDLSTVIKNADLKKEREMLFKSFDEIFLNLFPNYIHDFNKLMRDGEQITPSAHELLTPELRIFAMIRLGVKDNEQIAKFLNYSVSTIYTYKTKVKAKSLDRERFEENIMGITAV